MDRVRKEIVAAPAEQPAHRRLADGADLERPVAGAGAVHAQRPGSRRSSRRYTTKILERFRKVPGAVDVDSNLIVGNPEVHVEIDRDRAGNLGVDVADVANTLQLLVGGLKVSTYAGGGQRLRHPRARRGRVPRRPVRHLDR